MRLSKGRGKNPRESVSGLSLGKLSFILRQGLHCDTDRAPEIRVSGLPDVETLPA
jgi:hypothetical protein